MRIKPLCALLALTLGVAASTASAAVKEGSFFVSPVVGGITYEGRQHLETSPVFGARAGYNFTKYLGAEALFDFTRTRSTLSSATRDLYRFGGEMFFNFTPDKTFVPYLAGGFSGLTFKGNSAFPTSDKVVGSPSYGLGAKYFITDDIGWRADVRHLMYSYGKLHHAVEYTLGLYIAFGASAPQVKLADPPPPPPPAAEPVLPKAVPAPLVSLNATPSQITKGQSSTLAWSSTNASECDLQPGVGAVQPNGTYKVSPADTTMYAVICKGEGGSAKSTASVNVTEPVVQAEKPKASAAAERFCNKPAVVDVKFDTAKTTIKPQYTKDLDTLGAFLVDYPKARGEISGHTDTVASRAYNQKLSEGRADSVKQYLVKKFKIESDRISTKGYNFSKPIATNKTKAGRALNRRIETNFNCE